MRVARGSDAFKRGVDVVFASATLVVSSPLLAFAVVALVLETGRPVLFRQRRVGRAEREFDVLKLRTMSVDPARVASQTHSASPGVTRVGRVLRRTKIDELPQLINVLRGEMSLVGPRPCMPALLAKLDGRERGRFAVRPGLTGLAQVNGNVALSWPERCVYDVSYVERRSLGLDMRILSRTVLVVLFGEQRFRRSPGDDSHLDRIGE